MKLKKTLVWFLGLLGIVSVTNCKSSDKKNEMNKKESIQESSKEEISKKEKQENDDGSKIKIRPENGIICMYGMPPNLYEDRFDEEFKLKDLKKYKSKESDSEENKEDLSEE